MAIYYWNNQGRLGNLLFQYNKLCKCISDNDVVICFDSDMFSLIEKDKRFIRIQLHPIFGNLINNYTNKFVEFLSRIKFISSVEPNMDNRYHPYLVESKDISMKKGLLNGIIQFKGYYQDGSIDTKDIRFDIELLKSIKSKLNLMTQSKSKVAVHIRLTDYKNWSVLGKKDVTIDIAWYRNCINEMMTYLQEPQFIIFSDEPQQVSDLFSGLNVKFFSGASALEDIIAISLCEHAIISPSTFAWWGANKIQNENAIILAPEYWAGFKSNVWFPLNIKTKKFQYRKAY